MSRLRRLAVFAAAAALPALGLTLAGQAAASAAPNFQVPFKCGVTVTAATFSGHSPEYSVDFQKSGITGMPVLAAASGTVTRVADEGSTSYGKWIEVDHGSGWRTRYAHLSAQEVSVGQSVAGGKELGKAGATGSPARTCTSKSGWTAWCRRPSSTASPCRTTGTPTSRARTTAVATRTRPKRSGSGFSVVDQQALANASGTAYLLYNASTKANCVTTLKATSLGTASPVSAFLEVQGSARATDSGSFTYYAGPVTKTAGATCVKWGGSVGGNAYESGFEHCG